MNLEEILPKTINTGKKVLYGTIAAVTILAVPPVYSAEPAPAPKGAYFESTHEETNYSKHNQEYHKRQAQEKWYPGYFLSKITQKSLELSASALTRPIHMELSPIKSKHEEERKKNAGYNKEKIPQNKPVQSN